MHSLDFLGLWTINSSRKASRCNSNAAIAVIHFRLPLVFGESIQKVEKPNFWMAIESRVCQPLVADLLHLGSLVIRWFEFRAIITVHVLAGFLF